jgi:hypothetical protein
MRDIDRAHCDVAGYYAAGRDDYATALIDQYRRRGVTIVVTPELLEAGRIARTVPLANRLSMAKDRPEITWQWVYRCAKYKQEDRN